MTSYEHQITIGDFPPNSAVIVIEGGTFWETDGMWLCGERNEENIGDFSPGSRAVVDGAIRYVRGRKSWLLIDPTGPYHTASNSGAERPVALRVSEVQQCAFGTVLIIQANEFRNGRAPDAEEVTFDVPMFEARQGHVDRPDEVAFTGEMGEANHQKASVRFGLPGVQEPQGQSNIRTHSGRLPMTRGQLAKVIAGETGRLLNAVAIAGQTLQYEGRRITFDNLFLAKIKRVSKGSVQVTLGILGVD